MRTITVGVVALGGRAVTMRETTIRDLLETQDIASGFQRSVEMLGRTIIGDDGKPVGLQAVLEFPSRALTELCLHMQALTEDEEAAPVPLVRPNGSGSVSHSH